MFRTAIAAALFAATLSADEPKKDDKKAAKPDLKKLMTAAHKGEKSPHAALVGELKKETPDWAAVGASAKAFGEMGATLKANPTGYTTPALYIAASEKLAKAATAKDKKAATEAFTALRGSCTECHTAYGGIRFTEDGLLK
jgi:hypothetical protein